MFEITGDDIAALSDADLRTLIGLLCEAEMRERALPTSAVTWGGNQTAKDGGLDVRVSLPSGTPISGFIPHPQTGFQVKKSNMQRTDILKEMKPKPAGILRPVLIDLADASGSYIIVSSNGSTSDPALTNRRKAMAEALEGTTAEGKLGLDFYDRSRIATWVRDHPGWIPWVRSRIGRAISGWQSHGSWSHAPEGVDTSYLADAHARIRMGDKDSGDGVSAIEGINYIRKVLSASGHVVRLVGLSGVGKTRFVEALFEQNIGEHALDPSLAYYTNVADEPDPSPTNLASDLNAGQTRAILVIDNCPADLHHRLSAIARGQASTISVVTIEYDIREDQPEGTDVFALDTSSLEVIEKLVARRYPNLSQVDARTVAEFSGGNARVALALASQIEKTETVAGLSDEELFKRLFQQRKDPDPSLLSIAQACSLVYSFEGETLAGDEAELLVLGKLIGKSPDDVYAGVAELKRRDLVQERAEWRAVLPHAIANRLAKMALQNVPLARIQSVLVDNASERILRSFSRRLGYLDDSKEARAIVQAWLSPKGLLCDVVNLNELDRAMLDNIAPVMPQAALSTLEAALSDADSSTLSSCTHFVRLLRSLAYEPDLFERALALIVKFAILPRDGESEADAVNVVRSLFYLMLSGTHAPIEMRIKAADRLLRSENASMRSLGVEALEALMKTGHFSSHYEFSFGARSRDHGYYPRGADDVRAWFGAVLKLAETIALSDTPVALDVQAAIAREFRGLWNNAGQHVDLDRLAREIAAKSFWRDGWIAARRTRIYDGKSYTQELLDRLTKLEAFLRPKDLVSKVQGLVIGARGGHLDLDDFEDEEDDGKEVGESDKTRRYDPARAARSTLTIRELGHDVAADDDAFKAVLPELMGNDNRLSVFAEGLAAAAERPHAMWAAIVVQFAASDQPGTSLLRGFVSGLQKRDAALSEAILDEALTDSVIAHCFPYLQAISMNGSRAAARLHSALEIGKAPIHTFYSLAYGGACEALSGPQFRDLVLAIARQPGGLPVGLEIISNRLYAENGNKRVPPSEVLEAGRLVLSEFDFHGEVSSTVSEDFELGVVARASLAGPEGIEVVRRICQRMMTAAANHRVSAHDYNDLVKSLFRVHPTVVLDELFGGDAGMQKRSVHLLRSFVLADKRVFDVVPDDVLLTWCDHAPAIRYPLAAAVATLFKRPEAGAPHEWTPLAVMLLEKAPDPRLVLNEITRRLYPSSWSGSLAAKLEGRLKLFNSLPVESPLLATAISGAKADLQARIDAERRREAQEGRPRSARFE